MKHKILALLIGLAIAICAYAAYKYTHTPRMVCVADNDGMTCYLQGSKYDPASPFYSEWDTIQVYIGS